MQDQLQIANGEPRIVPRKRQFAGLQVRGIH